MGPLIAKKQQFASFLFLRNSIAKRAQVSTTHLDGVAGGILVAFSPARPPSTPRAGIGAGPARGAIQIMLLVVPRVGNGILFQKIPRNILEMVSVIPQKKVLIQRHSEFCGRANSDARN